MQPNKFRNGALLLCFSCMATLFSCSNEKTTTEEQVKIEKMDSATVKLKESEANLEDQTKKVEKSLEDLDKEFDNNNK